MTWSWNFLDEAGKETQPGAAVKPEGSFTSQSDAESWVGEFWRELADDGISAVTLIHDGDVVYGPMSLSSESSETQ